MKNEERIDKLLQDARTLEQALNQMRGLEITPPSMFDSLFQQLKQMTAVLQDIEEEQINFLMQSHQSRGQKEVIVEEKQEIIEKEEPKAEPEEIVIIEESITITEPVIDTVQPAATIISVEKSSLSLSDALTKKQYTDLSRALSLNDRFRFRRELFAGDNDKMMQTLKTLNEFDSYDASIRYLQEELQWHLEDANVEEFTAIIEKRFS